MLEEAFTARLIDADDEVRWWFLGGDFGYPTQERARSICAARRIAPGPRATNPTVRRRPFLTTATATTQTTTASAVDEVSNPDTGPRGQVRPVLDSPRPRAESFLVYAFTLIPTAALISAVPLAWGWGGITAVPRRSRSGRMVTSAGGRGGCGRSSAGSPAPHGGPRGPRRRSGRTSRRPPVATVAERPRG